MKNLRFSASVLAFLALAVLAAVTLRAQAIQRGMFVSVVDQSGRPVADLGPPGFIVREDNASREVLRVSLAEEPMQVAVLVDNSTAAQDEIVFMRRALPAFVEALTQPSVSGRRGQVAIIALAQRPTILAEYTSDRAELNKAIDRLWEQSQSGMYLQDALIEVASGFKKREATRPVIVAITTEGPDLSFSKYEIVLPALKGTNVTFQVITVGRPSADISSDAQSRDIVLEQGPALNGGAREHLLTAMALPGALQKLADVLTHQYHVIYASPDSSIPPARTTVSARRADLIARGTLIPGEQGRR